MAAFRSTAWAGNGGCGGGRRRRCFPLVCLTIAAVGLLLLSQAGSRAADPASLPEDFGRWERAARACDIQMQAPGEVTRSRFSCSNVRLDQQVAGLLSLRLLPVASGRGMTAARVVFAGVLQPGSRPMRCREGRCDPIWPLMLQVNAVAGDGSGSFGVLQARIAQGACRLERRQAACLARDSEGRQWQARLRW